MMPFTFLLFFAFHTSEARQCGIPGLPSHGSFVPQEKVYNEDNQITYTCHNGYFSKRDSQYVPTTHRTCQCNGIWDGDIPSCNYYDFLYNTTLSMPSSINGRYLTDGDDTTCGKVTFTGNRSSVQIESRTIHFTTNALTVRIQLGEMDHISDGVNMSILFSNSSGNWTVCKNLPLVRESRHILITCPTDKSLSSIRLKVEFDLARRETGAVPATSVCSLQVLALLPNVTCGSPDLPHHGYVSVNLSHATYSCESGYALLASDAATCQEKDENYHWHVEKTPVCLSDSEKECKILPAIQNGRLIVTRPNCFADYNVQERYELASIQCNSGYTLRNGNGISYCNEITNWTWQYGLSDSLSIVTGDECVSPVAVREVRDLLIYACTGTAVGAVLITMSVVLICKRWTHQSRIRKPKDHRERVFSVRASFPEERSRISSISKRLGINSVEDSIYCTIYEKISKRFSRNSSETTSYCTLNE